MWNVSNYGGFSFHHPLEKYDTFFFTLLRGKVVVFMNNLFPNEKNEMKRCTHSLGELEIF